MTAMKAGRPSTHAGVRCACWCGDAYSFIPASAIGTTTFVCGASGCAPPEGIDAVRPTIGAAIVREPDAPNGIGGCVQCGGPVPKAQGRGRPRKRCDDCHVAVYGPASLKARAA